MRQILCFSVVIVVLVLLATAPAIGAPSSDEVSVQPECTLETIQGTYVFHARGSVLDEQGEVSSYAEAGTWTLDGEGNAVGVLSASIGAVPFARAESFAATYELKSNCVYAAADAFGLEFDLYTMPSGNTITYFSPGFSGIMFRQ